MKKTSLAILVILGLICRTSFAEEFLSDPGVLFKSYTVSDGLPHISVTSLMQDSRGFLFFGTYDGLGIFDGLTFRSYKSIPGEPSSLLNNRVRSILEDATGRIYIGTEQGICVYNPLLDAFEETGIPGIDGQKVFVTKLFEDSRQRIWILTNTNYLFVVESERGLLEKIVLNGNVSVRSTQLRDIVEDKLGNIWICSVNKLFGFCVDLQPIDHVIPSGLDPFPFNTISVDRYNHLWIASENGLFRFSCRPEHDAIHLELIDSFLPGRALSKLLFDKEGCLWTGEYENGLYRFIIQEGDVVSIERYYDDPSRSNSLKNNTINCLLEDRQGGIWIGGPNYGLSYYNPGNIFFQSFCKQTGMPGNIVLVACRYDHGKVLLGLHRKGVAVYNTIANSIEEAWFDTGKISTSSITSLFVDSRRIIWIGTDRGLFYVLPGEDRMRYVSKLIQYMQTSPTVSCVAEDGSGHLWVSGYNSGLFRLKVQDNGEVESLIALNDPEYDPERILDVVMKIIYYDPAENCIWVGTYYHGLFRFSPISEVASGNDYLIENFRHDPLNPEGLQSNFIGDIIRDSRGRLWIGTEGSGFSEMMNRDGRVVFVNYSESNGLSHNVVKCIVEDQSNRFFISTNNKLNYFDPSTSGFIHFSTNNGLKSDYFSNAAAKLDDGRILFGGNSGISIVNPALIPETDQFPEPYFGQFKLFSRVIQPGESVDKKTILETSLYYADQITLRHNQNTFSVELSGIGFQNLDQVRLKYRLKGYDNDWQYAWAKGNNMVTYTRVPPGSYVLEYYMSNPAGLWNEHPKELKIQVRPPFWLTGWAIALYALLSMVIVYVSFAIVLKFERMKGNVRVSRIEKEKEKELTEAKLRFFTNISHEFRTPLTLINGPVEFILTQYHSNDFLRHNLNLVKKQTNYLLRLLDQLLEFRKSEMKPLTLKWYKTDIVKFVWQITKSFNSLAIRKNIQFEYVSDKGAIDLYFDPQMIEKVIYNLLSNAFKYTPECGRISLRIGWGSEGFIRITVKDSGVGIPDTDIERVFERFYQVSNNMNQHGTGIGLSLSRLLVELHGGRIHAEKGLSRGAVIIVELPLGKAHLENTDVVEDDKVSPSDIYLDIVEETVSEKPSWEHVRSKTEGRPKLVVVDDNFDMRDFISEIFHDAFDVFQYKDGKVALNRIRKIRPDVVISDLMMPVMDGIELCRELRADPATSHTLFIILTGQYSSEMRLKGLEAGADDFIIKPFRVDYLRLKVKNMLDNQSKVKARYKKGNVVSKNIKNRSDKEGEEFLYTVFSIIQQNISNPEFTNEEFSKAMAMSATKLNTSLKRLTGRSPNELIRDYRVRKAAELLKHEDHSIQDILSLCGFHSRSYFYKCFREVFHTAPVQYQKQQNSKETQTKQGELDWGKVIR